jgi:acetyl esterase/lipase
VRWLVLFFVALLRPVRAQPESQVPAGFITATDIAYGTHFRQKLDLTYCQTRETPLLIFIHGGSWTRGDKSDGHINGLIWSGYAIANINYRLSQDAVFPAQIQDCRQAVRWLREHAPEYHLDTRHFAVIGESAGGHLAALVATTGDSAAFDTKPESTSAAVQAAVCVSAPTNLALYGPSREGDDITRLLGAPSATVPELVRSADPASYVSKGDPPFLLIHGEKDSWVPLAQPRALEGALRNAGVPVTLRILPDQRHEFGEGTWVKIGAEIDGSLAKAWEKPGS